MMNDEQRILRIFIDGEWTVSEWAEFMTDIDALYADFALILVANEMLSKRTTALDPALAESRALELFQIVDNTENQGRIFLTEDSFDLEERLGVLRPPPLRVYRIQYGSAGQWDFLGIGKAIEAVKETIKIPFGAGPKERAEAAVLREQARKQAIENAGKLREELEAADVPPEIIQKAVTNYLVKAGVKIPKYKEEKRLPKPPETLALPPPKKT